MSKQTAVEWIQQQVKKQGITHYFSLREILEKGKEMEKEQLMEAHGDERDYRTDSGNFITISAEQYYNETYKKEEK
jgi:hypothetical protein